MKKARMVLTGCMMLLALILLIGSFYATPTVAAELNQTSKTQTSEYNQTPVFDTNYCGDIGYLPPNPNMTEAENRGRCTWYLWSGGNEKFYRTLSLRTNGAVDLYQVGLNTHN